ncbi:Trs120-domain-containing protein [Backusella circina FSU 941]|nr:Trs120-domain-containing protein [Backusella circina FSU 941]
MLAKDITSLCKIRVLLVPISPIKKSTFDRHVALLQEQCQSVSLADITPSYKGVVVYFQSCVSKFNSQTFQQGQLHFQFQTEWTREEAHLQDFQPYRRLFGVIGIMDCQEWNDLSIGYHQFEKCLSKYPTAIATRCFAFDPIETQQDDTKGLIMIPNVGNISFYMTTMISDFASDILAQFENLAHRLESFIFLESPTQPHRFSYPSASPATPIPNKRHSLNSIQPNNTLSITIPDTMKARRKTPGRIQKLLGDLYLLAGLLPDAIKHYNSSIEMSRTTLDYLWLASALEGWLCALILLEYLQADMSIILSTHNPPVEPSDPYMNGEASSPIIEPIVYLGPWSILTIVSERYEKILRYYDENPLIYSEACLRISRFLMTIYLNRGCHEVTFELLTRGKLKSNKRLSKFFMVDQKKKSLNLTKIMISGWLSRAWHVYEDLGLLEKIHVLTHTASLYSLLGYQRKCAWLLNEALEYIMALVMKGEKIFDRQCVFAILKRVCEVYGIKDTSYSENVFSQKDTLSGTVGWPLLQIDVLKKCITISELLHGEVSRFYYTSFLLRKMESFITRAERIRLGTIIQGMIINSKYRKTDLLRYYGHSILATIQCDDACYIQQQESSRKEEDPFIYSPFTERANVSQQMEATLLKNELCEFKVTLANPFGFELEINHIELCTSGTSIQAEKTTSPVIIPANDLLIVTLSGIPNQTGTLVVRGCLIQIAGFELQEFLLEKLDGEEEDSFVKLKKSGLKSVKHATTHDSKKQENSHGFIYFKIIDEQPILEIKATSHTQNAISLFEGETTTFKIELENTGSIPIHFIHLHFDEERESYHLLSPEDQYNMEQSNSVPMFSHDGSFKTGQHLDPIKCIDLNPGQREIIHVNVFGKKRRSCQKGTIRIGYGCLQPTTDNQRSILHYLYVDVVLSIYPILDISNWDMMLFPSCHDNALAKKKMETIEFGYDSSHIEDILSTGSSVTDHCWITFDVKNIWMKPFQICINTRNDANIVFKGTISPLSTCRILFPLKRVLLSQKEWNKPIPISNGNSILPSHTRLKSFWYHQSLIDTIQASYQCGTRSGKIDMRRCIRFEECFKLADFEFVPKMINAAKMEKNVYSCTVESKVDFTLMIYNRLAYTVKSILRIKLPDQVLFTGNLQMVLPEFSDKLEVQSVPLYFLSKGQYDILYILEDIYSRNVYQDMITVHAY